MVRCCDRDWREGEIAIEDDESGSRTIGFGVRQERLVLGCDKNDRFWVDQCWGATISLVV